MLDNALLKENRASELGPRLETIPSVGPVTASALRARFTDPRLFEDGSHLSAWIGRSLLINGAMAIVRQAEIRPDKHPWVTKLLGRMSKKQAAVAIANKTARIAWAIMVHGGVDEVDHRAPQYRAEASTG